MYLKDIKYGTTRFDSKVLYATVVDELGQKVYAGRFDDVMEVIEAGSFTIDNWEEVSSRLFELNVVN